MMQNSVAPKLKTFMDAQWLRVFSIFADADYCASLIIASAQKFLKQPNWTATPLPSL